MDECGNLTIKHSLPVITNIAWKQNSQNGWMWKSTIMHSLAVITNMGIVKIDGCGNLTIKHSHPVLTNIEWKQNSQNGWIWNSDNQALTYCNHKHGTEAG